MKSKKIFWGILLIALAGLLLLDAFGVWEPLAEKIGKISIWAMICGAVLLLYIIRSLMHWKISRIFVPCALLFMLFEENIAVVCGLSKMNIINNWILLLVAVLLTVGFAMIFPAKKVKKMGCCRSISTETVGNYAENSLGRAAVYIDSETFSPSHVENNLGASYVYFKNPEAYTGNGVLYIENNLGSLVLHIPSAWCAKISVENHFGSLQAPTKENGLLLHIKGENNLGSIRIVYI